MSSSQVFEDMAERTRLLGHLVQRCSLLELVLRGRICQLFEDSLAGNVVTAGLSVDQLLQLGRAIIKASRITGPERGDAELVAAFGPIKELFSQRAELLHGVHSANADQLFVYQSKRWAPGLAQGDASPTRLRLLATEVERLISILSRFESTEQ